MVAEEGSSTRSISQLELSDSEVESEILSSVSLHFSLEEAGYVLYGHTEALQHKHSNTLTQQTLPLMFLQNTQVLHSCSFTRKEEKQTNKRTFL